MKPTQAILLLGLSIACSGCALVQDACRNAWVNCSTPYEEHRETARNREWAEAALQTACAQGKLGGISEDFASGFKDGFVEYLFRGGEGLPPLVAPYRYRNIRYQNPQGYQAIQDWFTGFRVGAATARDSGARKWITGPSSLQSEHHDVPHQEVLVRPPSPAGIDIPRPLPKDAAPALPGLPQQDQPALKQQSPPAVVPSRPQLEAPVRPPQEAPLVAPGRPQQEPPNVLPSVLPPDIPKDPAVPSNLWPLRTLPGAPPSGGAPPATGVIKTWYEMPEALTPPGPDPRDVVPRAAKAWITNISPAPADANASKGVSRVVPEQAPPAVQQPQIDATQSPDFVNIQIKSIKAAPNENH
jgi:hypothetical protein